MYLKASRIQKPGLQVSSAKTGAISEIKIIVVFPDPAVVLKFESHDRRPRIVKEDHVFCLRRKLDWQAFIYYTHYYSVRRKNKREERKVASIAV
jgi:hypothetical protein